MADPNQTDPDQSPDLDDPDQARAYLSSLSSHVFRLGDTSFLHPDFAVQLANSVKQARTAGLPVTVQSGYRTNTTTGSAYDASGMSLHGYGAAADVGGIGGAGSPQAQQWAQIAAQNGLSNPYGVSDPREFNHWQLVPWKLENRPDIQKALASSGGDLTKVWNAVQPISSGVSAYTTANGPVSGNANAPASKAIASVSQPRSQTPAPPADVLKAWNLDGGGSDAPAAQPQAAPADVVKAWNLDGGDGGAPAQAAAAPPADVLKAWNLDGGSKPSAPADVIPQEAGKPLLTDPSTGYTVSRNDQGYTSLTDPKTGKIIQQFAPGDYEAHASQGGSFAAGALNGIPIVGPAIVGGLQRAAAATRALTNDTPYSQELANVQGDVARDQAAFPKTNTAGGLTGATLGYMSLGAIPGANALLGAGTGGLLARSAVGAGSNAVLGAADAYERGDNPLVGAMAGGTGGLLAPSIGKGVGALVGGGLNKLTDYLPSTIPGVGRPAANMLSKVLTADDPNAVQGALAQLGPLGTLADAGPSLQSLTTGLASKPGDARSAISDVLTQRGAGRDTRLLGDVDSALGPAESPQAVTNNILEQRKLQDGVNYAIVHANAPSVDASSVVEKIDDLLGTATGNQKKALQTIRSELVKTPETATADGTVLPEQYHDNSRLLHNVRMDIDSTLDGSAPGLGVPAGAVNRTSGSVVAVRNALDDALKEQVPGMREADAASSMLADRANAVQSGTGILDSGKTAITPSEFADARSNMDPGQAIAENKGLRGEIDRLVGTKRNDLVALQNALQGQGGWNTQKLATAFGDQPTNSLLGSVNREARFAGTENELLRNSRTDRSAAARQMLDESDPSRINLSGVTPTGLVLQGAKSAVVDPLLNVLLKQDNSARNGQLANALMAQGPARDALVNRLMPFTARQNALTAGAQSAGGLSDALVNLLTRAAAPNAGRGVRRAYSY